MVTLIERQKAEKLFELQKQQAIGGLKGNSPSKLKTKNAAKPFVDQKKGFSKGEKDLYKAVEEIKERELQKTRAEEEKTKAVSLLL